MKNSAPKKEPGLKEEIRQRIVIRWAALHEAQEPRLKLLHAIPNGGHRNKATAGKMKSEGQKPGVPDLDLPCRSTCGTYTGLHIEMKRPTTYPTPQQRWWLKQLSSQGRRTLVCHTEDAAVNALRTYLGREDLSPLTPPTPQHTK